MFFLFWFFLFYFFFVFCLRSAAPSALQRRGLVSRRPRGLGVVWPFAGFTTRTDGASARLALSGGKGGFVLWCCAVAGLRGRGVHALPVWLPIHCTIFAALQPVIRPPYYYYYHYLLPLLLPSSETVTQRGGSRHRYLALWVCYVEEACRSGDGVAAVLFGFPATRTL